MATLKIERRNTQFPVTRGHDAKALGKLKKKKKTANVPLLWEKKKKRVGGRK